MSPSSAFFFQQFSIKQDQCAMKVGIDSVLLGSWSPFLLSNRILDIGTGTGILSLMLAQRTQGTIDAVELDNKAYQQATENIKDSIFHNRIHCFNSSIQDYENSVAYDLIISNPPYFEDSLKSHDAARNRARHTDGLSMEDLFSKASKLLASNGQLAIILPYANLGKALKTASEVQLYAARITKVRGREHKSPNRVLLLFQKDEIETKIDQLTVYSAAGGYTQDFKNLTQDFYLPSIFR